MEQLRKFLERRARALEASGRSLETTRELTRAKRAERETCQSYQSNSMSCPVCKKAHRIYACPAFLSLSLNGRHQRTKELRLCFNCLKEGHSIKSRSSKKFCQTCNKKHNTLLHRIDTASVHFTENAHTTTNVDPQFTGHQQESRYTTVLPTAIVSVIDSQNILVQCWASLDSGSQLSFITEKLADALNLNKDDVNLNLSGIGGKAKDVKAGGVKLVLKSGSKQVNVSAYILKQLTNCIPSKLLNVPTTPTVISLAKPVDMILGAVFEELMENQRREISPGLFLRKTIFGWVLIGKQNESTIFLSCLH